MRLLHRRHIMSPLILFIFITSFSNALSRHRIRHHRDRFKRQQGAHLYLAGSYVFEGGERPDIGPWTDWSSPSPCSRSCGGGVSTQTRQCTPGYSCQGPSSRHFSCNTQDCPDIGDFRAQQCSEFDSVPFNRVLYQWIPYTKAPNPCELNCMPRGERFYYRHRNQVIDGTRCNDETPDVCINGKCQPVGCDMMLGSDVREDKCRVCGGDGNTCRTVSDRFENQDLQVGYNDILLIPAGATNILVEEVAPSNNYLAVRNTSGHYYLNGNWRIDFPRTMEFAGCKFHYNRDPQGFSAPDKITCLGPIDEALFIVMFLPTNIQPGYETETYAWTFDQFTPCTQTCGGGVQYRNVTCAGRRTLEPADRTLCDANNEPPSSQKCAEVPCEAQWVPYPWGNCSAPCGEGGVQTREIACQQIISNGYPSLVDESECARLPKPPQQQECNKGRVCAKWHLGPWKPCDHLCGDGKETRQVKCYRKDGSNIEIMDDSECIPVEPKPETERKCNLRPCEGVDWITSMWSGCEKCGLTNETRKVQCATAAGVVYPDNLCDADQKPETVRQCNATKPPTCEYNWYASQWSECSAQCGQGVQTRSLFCGLVGEDGSVKKVENEKCDQNKTYELIRNCTGEVEKCEGEWYSGPWTQCSKPCGGGQRTKKVVCLKDLQVVDVSACGSETIIFSEEDCNTQPCSEDTILPTDVTKSIDESSEPTEETPVTEETSITDETSITEEDKPTTQDDEYEIVPDDECEDGVWVDEEGRPEDLKEGVTEPMGEDKLGSSTDSSVTGWSKETDLSADDLMLSDAPSSPIGSEGTTVSGSGDEELTSEPSSSGGSTISMETTMEGSGDTGSPTSLFETDTPIETDSGSSDETEATTVDSTDSSKSTDESTDSSGVTDSSDASSDVTTASSDQTGGSSDAPKSSDMTTESSDSATKSSDMTSEIFSSDSSSESTETTNPTQSTDPTDSTMSTDSPDTTDSTDSASTQSSDSSESSPIDSTSSVDLSSVTESGATTEGGSSEATTIGSSLSPEPSETFLGESDIGADKPTTKSSDASTTESGATDVTESGMTDTTVESTESSTESAGSTEPSGMSSESGATETTTEFTGSTESPGSTESTEYTETTPTDYDIWTSTTESGPTEETSTDVWSTTPITDIFETLKPRMCKRKKQKDCKKTMFGCCWDKITPAEGPFDKGCPTPKTCKESKFGCCEDGVSPALGRKFKGCPSTHCNETLFGCCPDKKTPAEGNNKEGCPPPPPACLKSRYGCCEDNVTVAKGPKHKGCKEEKVSTTTAAPGTNCNTTKWGCCPDGVQPAQGEQFKGCNITNCTESYFKCCPDGVTPAQGPNYKGCKTPCAEKDFGCCPDGVTPAHGPSGEGCCLASPFGCCPDNILPARGPNLEGCGCQYSPYRCCPDNVTAARGHNNEGCGCQYTEHGCCPDEYTPAAGPEYQGCLCHTFQFGCCPDGVTVAKGPHQQGCGCRNTEFGCCSDDSTPAQGPNYAGCGCASSKYGCCLDGTTEALGDNYEGCPEIPQNLQESCTQPKERGTCRNYTVKWFFDMDYGGCSRFWYGGCDGNNNRFKSKEECDNTCVKPEGIDRCKLPKIPGPCEGYYPQWFYDTERKHCAQFIYGGCLGNNNRFETREECISLCVKDDSVDACEQEKDEGPCKGNYLRWYYDKSSKTCQQFIYGGCKSNNNNFPTEEACKQQCTQPGRKKDHCSLPRAQGSCTERIPRWYYDMPEKKCLPFYYSGCDGNNNNFNSREACETDCPKEIEKDLCQLAADIGTCGNYTDRWYYDTREKTCRQFYYGGCGGNGNNFETQQQCEQRCTKRRAPEPPKVPEGQFTTDMCFLPSEPGNCREAQLRYFYDRTDGVCKGFTYTGCNGNRNNFESVDQCLQNCGNAQDLCKLPPVVGPCNSEYEQFYYNERTDSCHPFNYGGCEGNYNRFPDKASCEQRCKRSPPSPQFPQTQAPPVQPPPSSAMCYEQPDAGNCTDNLSVFFFNTSSQTCTPFTYTGCGGNANRFNSEEQCERQCGRFRGQDVCTMPMDRGPCRAYTPKYYYDRGVGRCASFIYGGCGGNGNRFSSSEECEKICVTHEEDRSNVTSTAVCELPVDTGSCQDGYHKRWYFDNARGECIAFIFSGCGGNLNNFKTFQSCVTFCKDYLTVTQPPVGPQDHPCQAHFDECATLRCPYGIEAYVDDNQCNRCQCQNPCSTVDCPPNSQCAIDINRNKTSSEDPDFIAICREINKNGQCPILGHYEQNNCEQECRNDADCPFHLKCCSTGCGTSCIEPTVPAELVTQQYQPAYTEAPIQSDYSPPKIDVQTYEPEVQGLIGDHVTLRCAVTGNPTPKISWKKDDLLIDGTQAKYRIKLDQSLQIITLHKTDSGVYLCTADNSIGEPITNKIVLNVVDGPPRPATVLEPESQPNVVVSLNAPATLNCLALGYPFPAVTWWKDDSLIPLKTSQFEVRKDYSLLIHSVKLSNLGVYTCQAYNGVGKAASWSVAVKARGPYHSTNPKDQKYLKYIVNPPELPTTSAPPVYRPTSPPYLPPANNEIFPNREPGPGPATYFVPVRANITTDNQRFPVNSDIVIPCDVEGYPTPQVQWYKDGISLSPSERVHISDNNKLTILRATKADSGVYQCEAANSYSKASSSLTILVDEMFIHPNCKDNRFFANCNLIVKAKFCSHKYYAKFCCRSCTEAGLLPVDGPHLHDDKQSALSYNLV
ncbi:Papilin-like Protein [Tribolium castaneum]|uniref:Papilin-like Protein n=1 Tax=Tribolium castaneum TaxID=7070 RepID=A0A139WFE2_TRICA|nr:Papilin-like Protein [Tribolium castaneum]